MEFQIPINTLFTQVYGISSALMRTYKVPEGEEPGYQPKYAIETGVQPVDLDNLTNSLGTPVHFPMGFTGGTEYNVRRNGRIEKKFMQGMWLPFASVASFSRGKRVTETYMSGQNGSIIEEYGFEPWEIRVQGFIIKNDKALISGNSSVEDQQRELQEWENLSDAVGVKGRMFEVLNIHQVAILNISYPDAKGMNFEVVKPFEMRLRSVEPIELVDL